jgi:glucokinase
MTHFSTDKLVIGVDVGGTKVAAGFVDPQGEIKQHTRTEMNPRGTAEEGLAAVTSAIDALLELAPESRGTAQRSGICAPGPLDQSTGMVLNPPNVPCWRNFSLAADISRCYGSTVKIENDANAVALAEGLWGAGRGHRNVFYACIGTGIGTGVLFDGHIFHGRTGAAAEGGHVTIDYNGPRCSCGKRGCIEVLASGTAIGKKARAKLADGAARKSVILELAGGDPNAVTGEMEGRAHAAGDELAKEILMETAELLTVWLGNIVDLLEPDIMIIGGGAGGMLSPFFDEIRNHLPGWCVNSRCLEIPLATARYGDDAGIAGGAALCADLGAAYS